MEIGHYEQICDNALAFDKRIILRIRSPFLPLWHLIMLQHAFSVCSDICSGKHNRISIRPKLEQCVFLRLNEEHLAKCSAVG